MSSWIDSHNNLWLFGGAGLDSGGNSGELNDLWEFNPTTGNWTWINGSNAVAGLNAPYGTWSGVYGTLGVPATANVPPSRVNASGWIDRSDNLWLFGGTENALYGLNDFWKFNPTTQEWTWVGGSSSTFQQSVTGAGEVAGAQGVAAAANIPGDRANAAAWTDSNGNFWLFGGGGVDETIDPDVILDDMWMFNPNLGTTGEWAWMDGSLTPCTDTTANTACGEYSVSTSTSGSNTPGGRYLGTTWVDGSGNLWLFGGIGIFNSGYGGYFNDLWKFNPTAGKYGQWSFVAGSTVNVSTCGAAPIAFTCAPPPIYGPLGVPSATDFPGGRYGAAGWTDKSGNLWLLGGETYVPLTFYTYALVYNSDLWAFQPSGNTIPTATPVFSEPAGIYTSAQSISLSDTAPGANIYYTTNGSVPNINSTLYTTAIPVSSTETITAIAFASGSPNSVVASATYAIEPQATAPTIAPLSGTYTSVQSVTLSDSMAGAAIYYTTNGSIPTAGSTLYKGTISVSSTELLQAIAVAPGYANSAVSSASYVINLPPPNFTLAASSGSLILLSGAQGTVTITVTPTSGFNSAVTFACTGLPTGASCSFSPTSVTPPGTTSTTLTITAQTLIAAIRHSSSPLLPGAPLALAVCLFGWKRRRNLQRTWLAIAFASLGLLSGCSGASGSGGGGIKPVTSAVTVTATSGSIQQTTTVSLTVD